MSEGSGYGDALLCDGVDDLLQRTVGVWQPSPLWIFRGTLMTWAEKILFLALLDMWYSTGKSPWWYATNTRLMRLSALSKPTFLKARRGLVSKCAISYKSGNRRTHRASTYHISQEFLYQLSEPHSLKDKKYFSGGSVGDQPGGRLGNYVT